VPYRGQTPRFTLFLQLPGGALPRVDGSLFYERYSALLSSIATIPSHACALWRTWATCIMLSYPSSLCGLTPSGVEQERSHTRGSFVDSICGFAGLVPGPPETRGFPRPVRIHRSKTKSGRALRVKHRRIEAPRYRLGLSIGRNQHASAGAIKTQPVKTGIQCTCRRPIRGSVAQPDADSGPSCIQPRRSRRATKQVVGRGA
jgi:hypothetical protein